MSANRKYNLFGGIDPSFKGMGTSLINTINKTITFNNITDIVISTTYSKMVIKNSDDYYVIIYDSRVI